MVEAALLEGIRVRSDAPVSANGQAPLRIAACVPEFDRLQRAMDGEATDAAYILQRDILEGMRAQGHSLTYVAQANLVESICTRDLQRPSPAVLSWSASPWFELARKGSWRVQQWLGIPYLNVFSSLRHYDACLHCLPGHDVVYERSGLYKGGVARACKQLGLPYVLFVDADEILEHDYMGEPIRGLLRRRAAAMFRYSLQAATCVICVSEQTKKHLARAWHVTPDKIVVFPNGVDVERFRPSPETRLAVRQRLGVGDRPMVLFVGSFYPWHDVATLLAAFAQVLTTYPDVRLVLAGEGAQRQNMQRLAGELGIEHAVRFAGFVAHNEIPQVISAADIAVAPYPSLDRELWLSPMKLYEYMACGTAVVASAVGQVAEAVRDGENGLLVPPKDAAALAAAITRLVGAPALRLQLADRARRDAVEKHSWDRYLSRLGRLLEAVHCGRPVDQI